MFVENDLHQENYHSNKRTQTYCWILMADTWKTHGIVKEVERRTSMNQLNINKTICHFHILIIIGSFFIDCSLTYLIRTGKSNPNSII
jgi:hypothetical protein